jgi:4-amino-4-deoxy-L-arabinose transferase-like glycosyltransferase
MQDTLVKIRGEDRIPFWGILLVLIVLVVGIAGHEVWTPDEPREAAIARTIAEGESWLIPELGGQPFVEKPPLYYWVSALMMRSLSTITGPTAAARAVSALCAALALLLTWLVVRSFWGRFRGGAVLLIMGTSFGFVRAGHWIIIDPLLMLLVTASVLLLFLGLDRERESALLAGYLAAGLAFLTKGFVAWMLLFLPWGLLGVMYFRSIRRRPRLHLAGLLLLLGPPAVWMAAFYLRAGPELWREWFIDNQIGRFTGGSTHLGHLKGPFYYFWLAPVALLPWTPVIIDWLIRRGWRSGEVRDNKGSRNLLLLIIFWGAGGLILLSLAGTKREVYFYPLIPAFAIIAAAGVDDLSAWVRTALRIICLPLLAIMVVFTFLILDWTRSAVIWRIGVNLPCGLAAAAGILSFIFFKSRPVPRPAAGDLPVLEFKTSPPVASSRTLSCRTITYLASISALFYITAALTALPLLDKVWSYKPMTLALTAAIPEESRNRVCVWGNDETTQAVFSYYSGIMLPMVREPSRVITILKKEDPDFDLIVIPRLNEFEEKNPDGPEWKTVVRAKKGRRRVFYLICGE